MGLLDFFLKLKPSSRKIRTILIVGLDNAGKTSILKKLSDTDTLNTVPTQGFNIKTIAVGRFKLHVCDIGGQRAVRHYWRHYFGEADALIFVIDAVDMQRMDEAKLELQHVLEEEKLVGVSLLVFANKQDLLGAIDEEEITALMQLNDITDRDWRVQSCSAKTGEGLDLGVAWIVDQLQRNISSR